MKPYLSPYDQGAESFVEVYNSAYGRADNPYPTPLVAFGEWENGWTDMEDAYLGIK